MPPRAARRRFVLASLAAASLAGTLGLGACSQAQLAPDSGSHASLEVAPVQEQRGAREAPAPAPISADPLVVALVELAAANSEVGDHLRVLAEEIGPRLTGSTAIVQAERWAVGRFESWGLAATREQWGELPVGFERGLATGQMIRPEREALEFTTPAWTPGTHGPGGPVGPGEQGSLVAGTAVRGQALRYPSSAAELRALGPYLRDAWIMVPWRWPAPSKALVRQIERAFEAAPIAGLVRAAGDAQDQLIHSHGNHRVDPAKLPKRVEIRLRGDQHAGLLERMAAGEYVELEFAVDNRLLPGPVPVYNVIAELPGSQFPDQRVIVGGHLDSWDGASGAVDNATGVATTMEAARLIATACARAKIQPRRTISFMLWSGEEQGLLGSKGWVEAHPERLAGISAVLVHDNGTNYISELAATPEMWATMQEVFAPVTKLAPATMPFALRLVEALPWESTDSTSFMRAEVPAFFWGQAGRSDYWRYHHTQHDHADAVIDEYQRHSALVVAIAAWQLAQLDAPLDREHAIGAPSRMIGVSLEALAVTGVFEGSVGAAAGLRVGDQIIAVDGLTLADREALGPAIQAGPASKTMLVERPGEGGAPPSPVELRLDWSADPDEPARAARREQRRRRFGPELRPWDPDQPEQDNEDPHE